LIANGTNNFEIGSNYIENKIKEYLSVSGSGTSMGNGIRSCFEGIFGYSNGLKDPFRAYGKEKCVIFKQIAIDKIENNLFIEIFDLIQSLMRIGSKCKGMSFLINYFLFGKAAGIDQYSMNFSIMFLLR